MARRRRKKAATARRNPARRKRRARRNPDTAGMTFRSAETRVKNGKNAGKKKPYKAKKGFGVLSTSESKSAKRSRAAKKAARTRARNKAKKSKAGKKAARTRSAGGKRRVSKKRAWNKGLSYQLRRRSRKIGSQIKRTKAGKRGKRSRSTGKRTVLRLRKAAVDLQRRYLSPRGGLSGEAKRMAKAHGLMSVNPSLQSIGKDILALLPSIGAMAGAFVAVSWVGNKVQAQLVKNPTTGSSAFVASGKSTVVVTLGLTAAAYGAARTIKPLNRFASAVLFGGAAVALYQALTMKSATGVSLANRIGLPIGEYVGMNGFVDVDGRQIGVNGLGRLNPMGDYVGVGDYVGMGSVFSGNTLGALGDGRDANHGIRNEQSVLDFDEDLDGNLSGSIFD